MRSSKWAGWRRRRVRLLVVAVGVALAAGVPFAWAAFTDVPPSSPFYADVNAVQGAGITQGCGAGKFCPTENVTRQADAAFIHRSANRVAYWQGVDQSIGTTPKSLGAVTVEVGGASGGTQFVNVSAVVSTYIYSTSGCPCETRYYFINKYGTRVGYPHYNMNDSVPSSGVSWGADTGNAETVVAVPSNTQQTFNLMAYIVGGTGSVAGFADITAITAPFGRTGANTLGATGPDGTGGPVATGGH